METRSTTASRHAARHHAAAQEAAGAGATPDDPILIRWSRRALTVPGFLLAAILAGTLLPIAIPVTLLLDARDLRRMPRTRFVVGIVFLLLCETAGIFGSVLCWTLAGGPFGMGSPRAHRLDRALQRWWAGALLHGGRRILGLGLHVVARRGAGSTTGRFWCWPATPAWSTRCCRWSCSPRFRLRYVLKRELLWDPCLDLVGNRLPNAFVRRGVGDPGEIARVAALARGLERDEGVVLFPEGTRFTPERRQHLLDRLDARG